MARVRAPYATVVVLLAVTYVLVPATQSAVVGAVTAISVAAIEFGVRRLRPRRARAWRCLAAALVVLAVGDILYLEIEVKAAVPRPYPDVADPVAVAGYFVLSVALFWLGRPTAPRRDETSLIDAISLTLSGSLLLWITSVRPAVESQALLLPGRLTAIGALLGYVAALAASVRLVLGWRRNAAVILLCSALVLFLVSEFFHGYQLVRSVQQLDGRMDLGYLALAGLCGAAALTPSMRNLASPASVRHSLTPWRLALIAIGMLVAPAVLVLEAKRGTVTTGYAIGTVAGLVSFLVLLRLSLSGRAYQGRADREHAVRVAAQAMVSAVSATAVVHGMRDALRRVRLRHGRLDVALLERHPSDRPPNVVVPGPGREGELAVPLSGSEHALVFTGPAHKLAELADLLRSLADQAALALQRIRLAEAAGAEERERYFRTLVVTSTDAILISREGRIDYATPPAETMFGRDVVGECFDDIVRRSDEESDRPQWPDVVDGAEAVIGRPGGDVTVVVRRRDLTQDPTVRGVVTTLRDVTAERALQRDLAYRATHDELTGMANARAWSETLSSETERRRGPGAGVAVIFIDLDDFKEINDRYGHPTGDRVLADVARRIRECLRAGDIAARVGGDEFAALLRGLSDVEDARAVAQRLAEVLAEPAVIDSERIESKASIGLSYTESQERIDALVRQADTALYAAKEQGKGRWTEFNGTQRAPAKRTVNDGQATRGPADP